MPAGLSIDAEHHLMKPLMRHAITTIHKALHPPLCMKHALEIVEGKPRYEFRSSLYYILICYKHNEKGAKALPCFVTAGALRCNKDIQEDWCAFFPCDEYGRPTHGEAEAAVNAWKEGE
jgi:hypothetical protein